MTMCAGLLTCLNQKQRVQPRFGCRLLKMLTRSRVLAVLAYHLPCTSSGFYPLKYIRFDLVGGSSRRRGHFLSIGNLCNNRLLTAGRDMVSPLKCIKKKHHHSFTHDAVESCACSGKFVRTGYSTASHFSALKPPLKALFI